jgi:hypothetical protein
LFVVPVKVIVAVFAVTVRFVFVLVSQDLPPADAVVPPAIVIADAPIVKVRANELELKNSPQVQANPPVLNMPEVNVKTPLAVCEKPLLDNI